MIKNVHINFLEKNRNKFLLGLSKNYENDYLSKEYFEKKINDKIVQSKYYNQISNYNSYKKFYVPNINSKHTGLIKLPNLITNITQNTLNNSVDLNKKIFYHIKGINNFNYINKMKSYFINKKIIYYKDILSSDNKSKYSFCIKNSKSCIFNNINLPLRSTGTINKSIGKKFDSKNIPKKFGLSSKTTLFKRKNNNLLYI